jgi:glycosyltransferase involved in cell wall biosynthesis
MIPITIVIMTKNEAARLPACLASLQNQFAEIFVVDSHSTDNTGTIAASHGARVIHFNWNKEYPKKKQWCLDHLPFAHDWILYLDADERLTPELIETLRNTPLTASAYWISADPIWNQQRLRYGQSNHKIALVRRGAANFPIVNDLDTPENEVEGHYQPVINGTIGKLSARMLHDCDPIAAWFRRHIHYAEIAAIMSQRKLSQHETGLRAQCKKIFYSLPLQGVIIFIYGYIVRYGFLDGRAGLDYALARAWYYDLTALFRRNKL